MVTGALSRRRLLRVAGAGISAGAAGLLGGCGGGSQGKDGARRPATDIELLNAALELEHVAVAAYGRAAGRLNGEAGALARRLRDHEREHVDRLGLAVRELGGEPRAARASYDVPVPRGRRAILRYAIELEDAAVASYLAALPRLGEPDLRATAAAILTGEAQHLAVLREALGEEPVPRAFVDGRAA